MKAWLSKFSVAFSGLFKAIRTQNSFWVHIPVAIAVISIGAALQLETWRWCVLAIAISIVIAAELFNTSIECLVKRLHPEHDEHIGHALDVAAAAVLVTSIGAAAVGLLVLGHPLWKVVMP